MRTVREIYEEYRIPPWLQEHQLRVAAVARLLCDRLKGKVNERDVLLAALFHDMGNILKFDLSPQGPLIALVENGQIPYWQGVQAEFAQKYADEHAASLAIAHNIGLSSKFREMIDNMRFSRTEWILREAPLEMKVAKYADLRTGPHGILPLQERLTEARERYRGKAFDAGEEYDAELLQRIEVACAAIEKTVCDAAGIDPSSITDETIAPLIEELGDYSVTAS